MPTWRRSSPATQAMARPQDHDHDHVAQVGLDEDQPGDADGNGQAFKQPAPVAVRFVIPVKEIRQRQDDHHLGQLGRLDGYQPGLDPAGGAEVGGADHEQQQQGQNNNDIHRHDRPGPEAIIDGGGQEDDHKADRAEDDLARHQTRQAHIPGNRGTDHGYSKHQGDNDRPQQPEIEMPPEVATEHRLGEFYYAFRDLTRPPAYGTL